jgi:putative transposase
MEAERVAQRWQKDYPRAAEPIRAQFEETLAVHDLPQERRRRVYTTNTMERLMREIKCRAHAVDIFPNESSRDRLVGAHFLERDETWQCERMRYLAMDHLEHVPRQEARKGKAA